MLLLDNELRNKVLDIFFENGVHIDQGKAMHDFSIAELPIDSFQYMSILVVLEEEFDFEFSDEVLLIDKLISFDAFCRLIYESAGSSSISSSAVN